MIGILQRFFGRQARVERRSSGSGYTAEIMAGPAGRR